MTTLLDFSASLEMTIDGSWRACEWLLGDEATVDGQGVTGKECIDRIRGSGVRMQAVRATFLGLPDANKRV